MEIGLRGFRLTGATAMFALIVGAFAVSEPSRADISYTLEAGVGKSDNLTRVAVRPIEEEIATAGIDLDWAETRRRLDADVRANLDFYDYLGNTYDNRVVGSADGLIVLGLVPDLFTWQFQDTFGQAQVDPFSVATPDSQENLNFATTGPDLTFQLAPLTVLRLFGRYSVTDYQRSLLDSDRVSFGVSVGRPSLQGNEFMLNATRESIDFSDAGQADYERDSLYVSYGRMAGRTELSVDAGYSWLSRDSGEQSTGALLRVNLARSVSPSTTLNLVVGTELTDASGSLRQAAGVTGISGFSAVTATSDPLTTHFATVEWNFRRNRTGLAFSISWNDDTYETQGVLDRLRWVYSAQFDRQLARSLSLRLMSSLSDDEYPLRRVKATELRSSGSLSWTFTRRIGLELLLENFSRDSSTRIDEFTENRAFLRIFWRSGALSR